MWMEKDIHKGTPMPLLTQLHFDFRMILLNYDKCWESVLDKIVLVFLWPHKSSCLPREERKAKWDLLHSPKPPLIEKISKSCSWPVAKQVYLLNETASKLEDLFSILVNKLLIPIASILLSSINLMNTIWNSAGHTSLYSITKILLRYY